jgi:zinc ribbon protein
MSATSFCGSCGARVSSGASFCANCGEPLPLESPQRPLGPTASLVSRAASLVSRAAPRSLLASSPSRPQQQPIAENERLFTTRESSALATFGAKEKQWAVAAGFVNMLLGVFSLVEPAEDFGSDGLQALFVMTFLLGMIAFFLGIFSRIRRSFASKALSAGAVREDRGVIQGSTLKGTKIGLGTGLLEVPKGAMSKIGGTPGNVGSVATFVFTRPASQSGRSKVILLSVNGGVLPTPAQCSYAGGQSL